MSLEWLFIIHSVSHRAARANSVGKHFTKARWKQLKLHRTTLRLSKAFRIVWAQETLAVLYVLWNLILVIVTHTVNYWYQPNNLALPCLVDTTLHNNFKLHENGRNPSSLTRWWWWWRLIERVWFHQPSPSCLKNAGELFITLLGCARRAISSPGNSSLSSPGVLLCLHRLSRLKNTGEQFTPG
jgi:hypothetical protein